MIQKIRHFFKVIILRLLERRIGNNIGAGLKEDFEGDILKLLEKYELFKQNNKNILRKVTIVVDVNEYPEVKLKLLAIENEYPESNK